VCRSSLITTHVVQITTITTNQRARGVAIEINQDVITRTTDQGIVTVPTDQ
jgi:Tfp pilus assembly protein PilZ